MTNPFQPGSDVVPDVWAGRVEQLSDWRDVVRPRRHAGLYETGRPFLFQLAGQRAWNAGTSLVITDDDVRRGWQGAESEASAHVERILNRLPSREREFVEAMAALTPSERTLTTIADRMGLPSAANVGPFSQRLDTVRGIIVRGKPYSFRNRAVEAYLSTDWPHVR